MAPWAAGRSAKASAHAALAARDRAQGNLRAPAPSCGARRAGPPVAALPKGAKVEIELVAEV